MQGLADKAEKLVQEKQLVRLQAISQTGKSKSAAAESEEGDPTINEHVRALQQLEKVAASGAVAATTGAAKSTAASRGVTAAGAGSTQAMTATPGSPSGKRKGRWMTPDNTARSPARSKKMTGDKSKS